jgi:histidinol-phosphate aminotransferase
VDALAMTERPSGGGGARGARPLARATVRDVVAYPTERTPCDADLSDNTNLFGAPPAALRELVTSGREEITRYPGLYTRRLREALAEYAGVMSDEVVTGCGSDDVIDSAVRAFAEPGESLAFSDPTFSMIPVFARVNGLVPVPVAFTPAMDIDPDALLATEARVIYICSPNNPTGSVAGLRAVERVIERAAGIVILDEAYAEFTDGGHIARAPAYERVIVTRTLSKAFGMAGFRIGYGAGSASLIREVEKVRGPYKENGPGERAAAFAVREDVAWMRRNAATAVVIRDKFAAELRRRGFHPLPSSANFLLLPLEGASRIAHRMREHGITVRPYEALRGIGDAVRITVGPWDVMERALDALLIATRELDEPDACAGQAGVRGGDGDR